MFTFSFADYSDPRFDSFGCLRVLNDDTVQAGGGFPTHSHANFEIWSYIISGSLDHTDSMGNKETLTRGHVQFTSAGTGISHSEFNGDRSRGGKPVRFLQIWAVPEKRGLKPAYQTGFFSEADKRDKLCPILLPAANFTPTKGTGPLAINNGLSMHASLLSPGAKVDLPLSKAHLAYIHVPIVPGSMGISVGSPGEKDAVLSPGDGCFVEGVEGPLTFTGLGEGKVIEGGGQAASSATSLHTEFVVMHFLK
jgi:redox-sensitive bicupin YhaK (pirin superfamily)